MPVIINQIFLDTMAKIIPNNDNTVNTMTATPILASGPLTIRKKTTLIRKVNIDKLLKASFFNG